MEFLSVFAPLNNSFQYGSGLDIALLQYNTDNEIPEGCIGEKGVKTFQDAPSPNRIVLENYVP